MNFILGPRLHDPIDECMIHYMAKLKDIWPNVVTLHDFQLAANRRPKVLVQVCFF